MFDILSWLISCYLVVWLHGGCCSLCHMGACNLSILSIFSGFLVLPAIATRVYLGMFRSATTCPVQAQLGVSWWRLTVLLTSLALEIWVRSGWLSRTVLVFRFRQSLFWLAFGHIFNLLTNQSWLCYAFSSKNKIWIHHCLYRSCQHVYYDSFVMSIDLIMKFSV